MARRNRSGSSASGTTRAASGCIIPRIARAGRISVACRSRVGAAARAPRVLVGRAPVAGTARCVAVSGVGAVSTLVTRAARRCVSPRLVALPIAGPLAVFLPGSLRAAHAWLSVLRRATRGAHSAVRAGLRFGFARPAVPVVRIIIVPVSSCHKNSSVVTQDVLPFP